MTLDPATVAAAHAQAERDRQPHAVASRTFTGPDLAQVRASNARRVAETKDRVRSIGCTCLGCDALMYAADSDADLVNESLTDSGVPA